MPILSLLYRPLPSTPITLARLACSLPWTLGKWPYKILIVIEKYKFLTKKIIFIRFIIKLGRISIDLKKVEAIVN